MNVRSAGNWIAVSAAFACAPVWAAEGEEAAPNPMKPEATLGAGLGYVSTDNTRFGQYSGMTKEGVYPLIDLDLRRRDDATGTWINLRGRNLGLESNELRFDHQRQGNWGYFLQYDQTPRYSQYTPLTTLGNVDSPNPVINGSVAREIEMKTLRKNFSGGYDRHISGNWNLGVRFSSEDKDGRRLFGRAGATSFQEFLVDPIDYTTRQWEVNGAYNDARMQLVAAYNGTHFENHKTALNISGSTSTFSPIALPPENQSHQFSLTGGYNLSQATRATFKASYMNQTQSAQFIDVSTTGRTDLGGKVATTFLQGGVTSRVTRDLTVVGNLRYENRDDKTPVVDYFNLTTTSTATGENEPRSIKTFFGKVEGIQRLSGGFTGVLGLDLEEKKRNTSSVRVVSFREKTEETTLRAELRRSMSETLNGSIAYLYASRGGSEWQTTTTTTGVGSNLVHPLHLADRDRQMLRGKLGWMASERVDVNFVADIAKDDYGGRTFGLTEGKYTHFAVDSAIRLNEGWTASAWLSQDNLSSTQKSCENAFTSSTCPNTAADPVWQAKITNNSWALGGGLRGKPRTGLDTGVDLQYIQDTGKWEQAPLDPAVQPLPESVVKRTQFKFYAKQAVDRRLSFRAQYIFDRFNSNDWQWTTWTYGDGTRVLPNGDQKVHFFALQLLYSL